MQNVVVVYNGRRMVVAVLTAGLMIARSEEMQGILNSFFETIGGRPHEEVIELLHSLFFEYIIPVLDDLIPQIVEDLPDDHRMSTVGVLSFLVGFITYFIYLMRERRRHRGGSTSVTGRGTGTATAINKSKLCIDDFCSIVPDEYDVFIRIVIDLIEHLQKNPIDSPTEVLTILKTMSVKSPRLSGTPRNTSTRVKKRQQRNIRPRLSSSTRVKRRPLTPRHRR
jgi:hypothetical protein